jgi:hypothetical protein
MLKGLGIDLIPASAPDFFLEATPTAVLVRQVLGAIAQFEKASLVAKLKAARDRKRARDGKCEGQRSHREMNPELVALVKRLRRRNPKTGEGVSGRRYRPKGLIPIAEKEPRRATCEASCLRALRDAGASPAGVLFQPLALRGSTMAFSRGRLTGIGAADPRLDLMI